MTKGLQMLQAAAEASVHTGSPIPGLIIIFISVSYIMIRRFFKRHRVFINGVSIAALAALAALVAPKAVAWYKEYLKKNTKTTGETK